MQPIQDPKQGLQVSTQAAPPEEDAVLPPLAEDLRAAGPELSEAGARVQWHILAHQHSLLGALCSLTMWASERGLHELEALAAEVHRKALNETPYLLGTRTPEQILAALQLPFEAMHRELRNVHLPAGVESTISQLMDTAAVELQRLGRVIRDPDLREDVELESLVWAAWSQTVLLHPHKRCAEFGTAGNITFGLVSTEHAMRYPASAYDFYLLSYNLLSNAVEAMDRGRISVQLSSRPEQGLVELVFRNEGSVIAAADLEKMRARTPFSTKSSSGGRGMPIVYDVVERYGGSLQVESDPARRCTTFIVRLPERPA